MSGRCCSLACAVFFEGHAMAIKKTPDAALGRLQPVRRLQMLDDLKQRDVGLRLDQSQDLSGMGLKAVRAPVPTLWTRADITGLAPLIDHLDRRRGCYPEPLRCGSTAHPAVHCRDKSFPEVIRKRFRHVSWPPSPAHILNHIQPNLGIPFDSVRSENALGLDWAISASWHAELAYRYLDLGSVNTGRFPTGDKVTADSYIAHDLILSAMYCW
jgi:hypothetical protein